MKVDNEGRPVEPHVSNANRVFVGFPFSSIKVEDRAGALAVAGLVERLSRLLAEGASAGDFAELANEAHNLIDQLRG